MVVRSQLGSRGWGGLAQILAMREGARRRQGDMKKMKGKVEKQRGVQVFIPGESGGWGDAGRLTRRDHAKPERAALGLEAGKGGHFTATQIIN